LESPALKKDVSRFEQNGVAIGTYTMTKFQGKDVNIYHRNVFAAKDGYCIDLHISKGNYTPGRDAQEMDRLTGALSWVAK
jgi:hypothetical protein